MVEWYEGVVVVVVGRVVVACVGRSECGVAFRVGLNGCRWMVDAEEWGGASESGFAWLGDEVPLLGAPGGGDAESDGSPCQKAMLGV